MIDITSETCILSLTSLHRRPYKHGISFGTADRRASKCAFRILCVLAGPLSTCHHGAWLVHMQSFLGVHGFTVLWPRTKGTASDERVHSFVDFCLIPLSKTCSFDVPLQKAPHACFCTVVLVLVSERAKKPAGHKLSINHKSVNRFSIVRR